MKTTTATGLGMGVLLSLCLAGCQPVRIIWTADQLISGKLLAADGSPVVEVLGKPQVVTEIHRLALCFDGVDDAIFVNMNPIEGWDAFTVEILFEPDRTGNEEQRFLHIEDDQQHRLLIETRVNPDNTWSLDTFLRQNDKDKLTLLDRAKSQPTDRWYWAALVYDGETMRHFVNGEQQLEGKVKFPRMSGGRISLGVRQNKVHWFKGCIAEVRFSPVALRPYALQQP